MSQRVLAANTKREFPMLRTYIAKIETGNSIPTLENIHAIAVAMGLKAHDLVDLAERIMEGKIQPPPPSRRICKRELLKPKSSAVPRDAMISDPHAMMRRRELAKKLGTLKDEVAQ
jgi:transcriptional regulator with XRE-family HTH domain